MPYANPEDARQNKARYRRDNKETIAKKHQAWSVKNSGRLAAKRKLRYEQNRKSIIAKQVKYTRERLQSDPLFRLVHNLRARVGQALKHGFKSETTLKLMGASPDRIRVHLESKFQPGMTWENYGPVWHVDHVKACAKFDLTDPEQQRACFNFTNLQPLFAEDNLKKGAN